MHDINNNNNNKNSDAIAGYQTKQKKNDYTISLTRARKIFSHNRAGRTNELIDNNKNKSMSSVSSGRRRRSRVVSCRVGGGGLMILFNRLFNFSCCRCWKTTTSYR